jgi:hypothetical protein
MHMQRLQQMRHPNMRPKMWFEPGEADMNSSEVAPRLSTAGHSVPMHHLRVTPTAPVRTHNVCVLGCRLIVRLFPSQVPSSI